MGILGSVFGSKPKLPVFKPLNIDEEVAKTISANQSNLAAAGKLSGDAAAVDTDNALANLEQFAPGSQDLIKGMVGNIQSGLSGELPDDVQRFISDKANASGFGQGFGGSGIGRNIGLRDLGLTSLQRSDQAISQSGQALQLFNNLAPRPQGVGASFLSPGQRIGALQSDRNAKFQADTQAAMAKAQADPVISGLVKGAFGALTGAVGGSLLGAATSAIGGAFNPGGAGGGTPALLARPSKIGTFAPGGFGTLTAGMGPPSP